MLLEGMHLPLTTPFFPDGRLNLRKLEQNVARYSLTPASGMVVLGANGEANLLTDAEAQQVLRSAIAAAATTKVMVAGVSREGVSATLQQIEAAALLGYDAVVLSSTLSGGQRLYFESVADRAALPILLAGQLPMDLLAELAFHPRVLGCVQALLSAEEIGLLLQRTAVVKRVVTVTPVFAAVTGRMQASQANAPAGSVLSAESLKSGGTAIATAPTMIAPKTRTKQVGFQILVSGTGQMLAGLHAGAVGAVPPLAAAAPQACYEVMAAWKDGDPPLAEEKQMRLVEAIGRVEGGLGVAGVKYGCDLTGYFGGLPRLPSLPLLGDQKAEIERLMRGLA